MRGGQGSGGGVQQAATGALLGLAFGDAMGFPTEFNGMAGIEAKCGPWRTMALPLSSGLAWVTDDTQMTLALGEGLLDALSGGPLTAERMEPPVRDRFVAWYFSPDNNRAPGTTCLRACEALDRGGAWQDASQIGSKGCGANMRVAPLGLVPGLDARQRSGAAQLQAALTHGHPTALAASDLTAEAVRILAQGAEPDELVPALRAHAVKSREDYRADWLGDLADRAHDPDPVAFAARGWDECLTVLDRLEAALAAPDPEADPCLATGAGWVAEEALATALYCFLMLPEEPQAVVRRAAYSSGDSDSIAALAGAFAGARHGAEAWPEEWVRAIEYRERLLALGRAWDA
ncbi:ADP-ribosylglycohydrolase family protein [Actinacidiphila acidipaludis]|uniref:ADP-ribosylglycohydrolase family protein n=1 Tax=Actinacidiphila acidipaludis TaxID=2873382 RepID=A0ABS7QDS4_9ACTN|nr:ADP-ribosylglycohydrolase family protein [Streptomyces acidipaludis]MBY8881319.1 ADP-ribosylglycohydrolase family protein [Streptomyces acidipaludis]